MEGIKIIKSPRLRSPYMICAWPGMGDVAFRAATYLVEKLQAQEFAEIEPGQFFYLTSSVVQDGLLSAPSLPYNKFYYWKNPDVKQKNALPRHDLIIFISNAQPDLTRAESYYMLIHHVAKAFKVKQMIGFAAMPQPIDHTQEAHVWFTATSREKMDELKKYNLNLLVDGQISGMNGLFLGLAKQEGIEGFCLLGEIPLYTIQIENPKASQVVLEALSRIVNIRLDLSGLIEQIHNMEEEINKLLDFLKVGTSLGPIGEEEIEKIKKSLSQLTKLPASIKSKIDMLFLEAKTNIAKAGELKAELDKWNVYKEYEDRFLDLFKKSKDSHN